MNNVNIFIALSTSAKNAINTRLSWDEESQGEYTGSVSDTEHKIFRRVVHHAATKNMWKPATFVGKTWHLYSLTFTDPTVQLKNALDFLAANRPNVFRIVGAWWWDGRQVGTEWNADKTATTGTPTYPIPSQLIKFMPDIITYNPDGTIASTTLATILTDVNLEQGMEPRRFT